MVDILTVLSTNAINACFTTKEKLKVDGTPMVMMR